MIPGVEPEVPLSLSLHKAPGTYAVFLGSGVSRTAEIPTGWDVTLDLVRELAASRGEPAGVEDPEAWYEATFGEGPNYSVLLERLARTQQERRDLLQGYFEPTDEDREQDRKLPTRAHKAVAELVAKGCVRVIVTTNFDRLMERALQDAGVNPQIISSEDDIEGAQPLQHARATVVKANGDYLDARIKNTPEELASYPPKMRELLERIFDEYGLVVSGWSAGSDTALLEALRGKRSRRYALYWATKGAPSGDVGRLVENLQGVVVESAGADELFSDLLERVEALEDLGASDVIAAKVAVQRVKRYLDGEPRYVRLRELVVSEGRELREQVFGDGAFPLNWWPAGGTEAEERAELAPEFKRWVLSYDRACEAAVGFMAAGGFYASTRQAEAFGELLETVATPPETTGSYKKPWKMLQLYPALRLLYAGGVSATAAGNWPALKAVLRDTMAADIRGPKPLALKLYPWAVAEKSHANLLFDGGGRYEPVSDWLFRTLREPLEEYLPLEFRYEEAFLAFEAMMALVHVDLAKEAYRGRPSKLNWAPLGRFAAAHVEEPDNSVFARLRAEYGETGQGWGPVSAGLLKESFSEHGTTPSVNTVGHDFGVVESMMGRVDYR